MKVENTENNRKIQQVAATMAIEDMWQEWRDTMLIQRAMDTSMQGMDYDEIFDCLSEQEQKELSERKNNFAAAAGIEL